MDKYDKRTREYIKVCITLMEKDDNVNAVSMLCEFGNTLMHIFKTLDESFPGTDVPPLIITSKGGAYRLQLDYIEDRKE